jgi:hypothetical protein
VAVRHEDDVERRQRIERDAGATRRFGRIRREE